MAHDDSTARLAALVGRWHTTGRTRPSASSPSVEIDAIDVYEWLPGRHGLLHTVDARVGDERVEGAEVIGFDPARRRYVTRYFGSDGPSAYEATLEDGDDGLVWSMHSKRDRFTGSFSDDGETISGHWEQLGEDGEWRPWMDIALRKLTTPAAAPVARYGKATAREGRGDELAAILLSAAAELVADPGCQLYLVNREPQRPEAIWVTELWRSQRDLDASLERVRGSDDAKAAMALVESWEMVELELLGGKGPEGAA